MTTETRQPEPVRRPVPFVADDSRNTFAPAVCFRLPGGEPQIRRVRFNLCGGWPCSEIEKIAREMILETHPDAEFLQID
jgi:hypothetical protein